ncbi:potassium channel protein [Marinobacter mangrovi]|uniref:potassium channel protein n=1 Tax=Marinobacter mangrovi TaxID=2803918 RepID=UPI00193377A5|nr:ion channel [Marinobacter mangrovi]
MLNKDRRAVTAEHHFTHLPMSGVIRQRLKRLMLILVGLVAFHVVAMMVFEKLSFLDAFWLTFTTLATVGYGDLSPATAMGRLITVAVMYILAITVLTLIVSDYIEYRFYRRERIITGRWRYNMKNHIVIINTPMHGGSAYFLRLSSQIRAVPGYETIPIQIVTQQYPEGLPTELRDAGLVHYHGSGNDPQALRAVNVIDARYIIVLAPDEADPDSDSITFSIASRLSDLQLGHRVTLECVRDEDRPRYRDLGIRTVIRPVRTYPEIMVRAVISPGSEKVLEDLFNYQQDHPHRYELPLDDLNWADIVSALIRHGIGTALAYIDENDDVVCHPDPNQEVEGKALIVLVKSSETPPVEELIDALDRYRAFLERWHNLHAASDGDTAKSE